MTFVASPFLHEAGLVKKEENETPTIEEDL
jgi:hypothetical protein